MIRLWLVFAIMVVLIHFGITAWRNLNGKERWSLTKTLGYSILVSLAAVMLMTVFVIAF